MANPNPQTMDPPQTVERTTMTWVVTFQHVFDVGQPMTRDEFVELVKAHIAEMQKQFPELLQEYPKALYKEMAGQKFLDAVSFQQPAPQGGNQG